MTIRLSALFLMISVAFAAAQSGGDEPLKVGVALFPPHVLQTEDGRLEGFDIDLWDEIARDTSLDYEFDQMPFEELLGAVRAGDVDAALAGITINAEREQDLDFSYAYMQSGLRILAPIEQGGGGLLRLAQSALGSGAAQAMLYLVGFLVLCAHLLWLAERGHDAVSDAYVPGIFEAAWCMLATITTVGYGDIAPRKWTGRFVAFAVMVIGISLFGVLVAQMSVGLTLQEMRSQIRGPEDLSGKTVATVAGSTSVAAIRGFGGRTLEVADIGAAVDALQAGRADAVVFDGPPLLHYVQENPDAAVAVVGGRLNQEDYGIAFPNGSPLREAVNRALLHLREDGRYDRLYETWFGVQP